MTTTNATYVKEIAYDRESRDFAMYLDGELVGYERTYSQAETALDELVYNLLSDGMHRTATELDGGSDPDVMAEEVAAAAVAPTYEYCPGCGEIYCECDDDYGDALAEGAMGTYNGRTTIDPPVDDPSPMPPPWERSADPPAPAPSRPPLRSRPMARSARSRSPTPPSWPPRSRRSTAWRSTRRGRWPRRTYSV